MRRLKPEVLHFTYYEALPGGGTFSVRPIRLSVRFLEIEQESLANTKVSAQQQLVYEGP